jgi:hypothetical protein
VKTLRDIAAALGRGIAIIGQAGLDRPITDQWLVSKVALIGLNPKKS